MTNKSQHAMRAFVAIVLCVFVGSAQAASSVHASAEIDWSSLIVTTDGSLTVELAPDGTDIITISANDAADSNGATGTPSSLGGSLSATSDSGSVTATGTTNSSTITATADASTPTPNASDFGSSTVSRLLGLTATGGSGTVTISFDFTVAGEVLPDTGTVANVGAIAGVFLGQVLLAPDGSFAFLDGNFSEIRVGSGSQSATSTITYVIDMQAGDALAFAGSAQVQVRNAVIPLPAAVYFLGSGLLALIGVRRRRH